MQGEREGQLLLGKQLLRMMTSNMMASDSLGIPDSGSGDMRDRINKPINMLQADRSAENEGTMGHCPDSHNAVRHTRLGMTDV